MGAGDSISIGGILFSSNDIIGQSSKRKGTYNNQPLFEYTVETKFGTFKFTDNDLQQLNVNNDKSSSIFMKNGKVVVNNCNLSQITGTNKSDSYVLSDTNVSLLNTKGDLYNQDQIILTGESSIRTKNTDNTDIITDLTSHGGPSPHHEPIEFYTKD